MHPPNIAYLASGFPPIANPLYCAVWARRVTPKSGAKDRLAHVMRGLHEKGAARPDVVVAGKALSLPANYTPGPEGSVQVDGTRPFITVDGNNPIFVEEDNSFGLAILHFMSSIEHITLGTLPWGALLREGLQNGFLVWGTKDGS